ncbi:MAG: RidA family protein [Candidatus Eremiobacteraeota bacterium]|nr:RidA family protein [Candidatus Eremiobacteraeota bacterium]
MTLLQPPGWPRAPGYAHGVSATGRFVFISGQIGWDAEGRFTAPDVAGQTRQALVNVIAILGEAGGSPEHVTRLTWFITDKRAYLGAREAIGAAYREIMGRHYPAMSVVVVAGLLEDEAAVEIEATAVIPARVDGSIER